MSQGLEAAILRRALETGLISADQLREVEAEVSGRTTAAASGSWGPRIELLIQKGLIDVATVETLGGERKADTTVEAAESFLRTATGPVGSAAADDDKETLPPGEHDPTTPLPRRPGPITSLPDFPPNQLLAGRFRIVRFIAQGGMGKVYEAEDLELRERVALKTIRPEIAGYEQVMERFKREIRLARRVTHPNVCRIFDVFRHPTPSLRGSARPEDEITFLTMELLDGETLEDHLRRTGPITAAEALPLVSQMVAALSAAHQAGVIHRDFKSRNVILVPTQAGRGTLRAVVTDFGLARGSVGGDGSLASMTAPGDLVGTPAYMAPEQVEGGEITTAVDIYALGVVIYEMLTGNWPFRGDTPLTTAVKRLKGPPTSPRAYVPDLDPRWEAAVMRCLERDPADRFSSAADVMKALSGDEVAAGKRVLEEQRQRAEAQRKRKRYWLASAAAAAIILLALALGSYRYLTQKNQAATVGGLPTVPIKARRSIAVLGFKNSSGRPEATWLSTAFSEMLRTELAAGEKLRTIPGENIARMKMDLALADTDSLAQDTLARIRANLGTDFVVLGSYLTIGERGEKQIRLDLRLQDAASGEEIAAVAETGTEAGLFELVSRAGARLREKLGAGEVSSAEAGGVRASLPSNPEAARFYAQGLERLRLFDAVAARGLLERAVAADPNHPLTHSALAAAWQGIGYDAKAREEAQKSVDLSGNLSREERLSVEGRYHETMQAWAKAIDIYRTLFVFFPDNLDYGLRLASAQTSAGEGQDALATVEALRKLPRPAADDPRVDLAEALAAEPLSDFKREAAAAAQAAAKAMAQGARLLVARARLAEGWAWRNLGQAPKAAALLEEAKQTYTAAGDKGGVAEALHHLAEALYDRGDSAGARQNQEAALAIYREIGNQRGIARMLTNIANGLHDQGDFASAQARREEALAIFRELGNKNGAAVVLNNLGNGFKELGDFARARQSYEDSLRLFREIGNQNAAATVINGLANLLNAQGDLSGAKRWYEEALAIKRENHDQRDAASALENIALVLHDQGDLSGAKRTYQEALATSRGIGNKSFSAIALSGIGSVLTDEGDLAGARQQYEAALALHQELGEKSYVALNRIELATLLIDEGRAAESVAPIREAAEEFRAEKLPDYEALALATLARALQAQGQIAEAGQAIEQAAQRLGKAGERRHHLSLGITAARILSAAGKHQEAMKHLNALLAEAKQIGFAGYQFDARLALGEGEIRSGQAAAGRERLATLEKEARAKGFGQIARWADAARKTEQRR